MKQFELYALFFFMKQDAQNTTFAPHIQSVKRKTKGINRQVRMVFIHA